MKKLEAILQFCFISSLAYLLTIGILLGFFISSENFPVFAARLLQSTAFLAGFFLVVWPIVYAITALRGRTLVRRNGFAVIAISQLILWLMAAAWVVWHLLATPPCGYSERVQGDCAGTDDLKGLVLLPVLIAVVSILIWGIFWLVHRRHKKRSKA